MSSSRRRSRFRVRVPEEDPTEAEAEVGSRSSAESSTDPGEYEADLESMTGKGIKRLCSELMELKRVSDDDFRRNVYSNYSAFVRIFEEIGGVGNDITELKKHASIQMNLIQAARSNFYAVKVDGLKGIETEDLGLSSLSTFEVHMQDVLVTLDIFLMECRIKEALALLEKEMTSLQKLQIEEDHSSPINTSYTFALTERRTRLADQLAVVAEHPRVSQPELRMALSGLCRLGEDHRANSLLLKFYRSRISKKVYEFECSRPCPYGTHVRELAKAVFSVISQAARSFASLHGETCPYSSELILWVREETETFSHKFCSYVRSISEMNGGLSLAIEAANSAVSLCALLKPQKIVLVSNLMELIRPCMEEALNTHVDHFRKVVHIFTTSDNWTLGKFLSLGILRDQSSLTGVGDKVEYCLLTSSGRKFVTLMQAIADDILPLLVFKMRGSILKGLADLFSEYMCVLEKAIPSRGIAVESVSPKVISAQTLLQQLSLLANAATLVHLFPSIAGSILKDLTFANDDLLLEQNKNLSQNELDGWILSIEEAADQLWRHFCQQFVVEVMSLGDPESATCLDGFLMPSSSQDPVPSFAFQALFVRLRQLEELSKSLFVSEDGMMEKLLNEIVETVITWLSNNQKLWTTAVERSCIRGCSCFEQVCLDMHFLMEIAVLGGYCSDDLMDGARNLIEEMEVTLTKTGSGSNGVFLDGDGASNAAKLAIKKLLEAEFTNVGPEGELVATSLEETGKQKCEYEHRSDAEESVHIPESSTVPQNGESETVEDDVIRLITIKDTMPKPLEGQMNDVISDDYNDNDGSTSSRVPYSDREDGEEADSNGTQTVGLSKREDRGELELERVTIRYGAQSVRNLDDFNSIEAQSIEGPQVILGEQNLGNELGDIMLRQREGIKELEAETLEGEAVNCLELDESNATAVKLKSEEQQGLSRKEFEVISTNLSEKVTTANLLEEREYMTETVEKDPTARPEINSASKFQDTCTVVPQRVTNELLDVAQKETLSSEVNFLHSLSEDDNISELGSEPAMLELHNVGNRDIHEYNSTSELLVLQTSVQDEGDGVIPVNDAGCPSSCLPGQRGMQKQFRATAPRTGKNVRTLNGMNAKISSESDDPSESPLKSIMLHLEKLVVNLERNTSLEELHQLDGSELESEPALLESQSIENADEVLSDNFSRLILATSPQMESEDGSVLIRHSEQSPDGLRTQTDIVVKRPLRTAASHWGTKGKGLKAIDSKISSSANNASNILVKTTDHDPERKLVLLEDGTCTSAMLKKLVQVEGERVLLELPGNIAENELLCIVESSLQEQGKDIISRIEGNGSVSGNESLHKDEIGQSQVMTAAEKSVNDVDAFSKTKNPFYALEKKVDLLEANDLIAQVDGSLFKDGTATRESSSAEEEDNPLSAKLSELTLKTNPQKRGSDSSSPGGGSGNTSGDAMQQNSGRKRTKSNAEENVGKSRKAAKALRPRWQ